MSEKLSRNSVRITPVKSPLKGAVTLPGSKSITNRALLIAALAKGQSRLTGALASDDTHYMAEALKQMGVDVSSENATTLVVSGTEQLAEPEGPLFLGNAGTAMRFLTAATCMVEGKVVLEGDAHMHKRPIGPLVDALKRLGVDASDTNGCPPVIINGTGKFAASSVDIDGSLSSQYISAILMAAPMNDAPLDIAISGSDIGGRGYIDITLSVMNSFGATPEETAPSAWRVQPEGYQSCDYAIEPDASAATYLWAAEVLTGGEIDLGVDPTKMSQPDARAYEVISQFPHMPATIEGSQMQDAIPTLAVLAVFNTTPVRFTGIENLRVKECDRVAVLHDGLVAIRPDLAYLEGDELIINGGLDLSKRNSEAIIDPHADHRMAMCFALAGLKLDGIIITDPDCVAKTFPAYWDTLASLGVEFKFN